MERIITAEQAQAKTNFIEEVIAAIEQKIVSSDLYKNADEHKRSLIVRFMSNGTDAINDAVEKMYNRIYWPTMPLTEEQIISVLNEINKRYGADAESETKLVIALNDYCACGNDALLPNCELSDLPGELQEIINGVKNDVNQ